MANPGDDLNELRRARRDEVATQKQQDEEAARLLREEQIKAFEEAKKGLLEEFHSVLDQDLYDALIKAGMIVTAEGGPIRALKVMATFQVEGMPFAFRYSKDSERVIGAVDSMELVPRLAFGTFVYNPQLRADAIGILLEQVGGQLKDKQSMKNRVLDALR